MHTHLKGGSFSNLPLVQTCGLGCRFGSTGTKKVFLPDFKVAFFTFCWKKVDSGHNLPLSLKEVTQYLSSKQLMSWLRLQLQLKLSVSPVSITQTPSSMMTDVVFMWNFPTCLFVHCPVVIGRKRD